MTETQNQNSLGELPPIVPSEVSLTDKIITAYRTAVAKLTTLTGENLWREKHRLFSGYRRGSKIEGVYDVKTVERLFNRITIPGEDIVERPCPIPGYPRVDAEGNQVYCFKLTSEYLGKGHSIYGRVSDFFDIRESDRIGVGMDYDDQTDTFVPRFQAPKRPDMPSNIVTIIMSGDNTKFIAWFCGEPKTRYTKENIHLLIARNGEIDIGKLWVYCAVDFDAQTHKTKQKIRTPRRRDYPYRPRLQHAPPPAHPPVNPMSAAILAVQPEEQTQPTTS
jgi:hypothetical protein